METFAGENKGAVKDIIGMLDTNKDRVLDAEEVNMKDGGATDYRRPKPYGANNDIPIPEPEPEPECNCDNNLLCYYFWLKTEHCLFVHVS